MLQNILKKRFSLISRAHVMTSSVLKNQQKKSHDVILFEEFFIFIYLFFLTNCKIMMRSICKLTLKANVVVNNILFSPRYSVIFKNSGLYRIKTLSLRRVLLNHCHWFHLIILLSGFSFTNIHNSQDSCGIGRLLL